MRLGRVRACVHSARCSHSLMNVRILPHRQACDARGVRKVARSAKQTVRKPKRKLREGARQNVRVGRTLSHARRQRRSALRTACVQFRAPQPRPTARRHAARGEGAARCKRVAASGGVRALHATLDAAAVRFRSCGGNWHASTPPRCSGAPIRAGDVPAARCLRQLPRACHHRGAALLPKRHAPVVKHTPCVTAPPHIPAVRGKATACCRHGSACHTWRQPQSVHAQRRRQTALQTALERHPASRARPPNGRQPRAASKAAAQNAARAK
jgi:hypothetical protein